MGDKTQLLSFVLAAKLKRKAPIALGILFATGNLCGAGRVWRFRKRGRLL